MLLSDPFVAYSILADPQLVLPAAVGFYLSAFSWDVRGWPKAGKKRAARFFQQAASL
jgi:predicted enzyme related to lactoylglutathione lyase